MVAPVSVTETESESDSRATSLAFVAADGSEVTWGRHITSILIRIGSSGVRKMRFGRPNLIGSDANGFR